MTPEEFRKQGHAIVDWIADYRRDVAAFPVMSPSAPGDVRRALPAAPPAGPEPFADIIRDLDRVIVPGITHWQHPSFFGYFPSVGVLSSVLGDFLSTGLGVIGLSWQAGPAVTELEEVVCDWLRQMLGLSGAWSGVIHDTASTNAIVALICARERASHFALGRRGLQGEDRPLVVYASAHAHSSVDKAALMAGFGRENVRLVPCDEKNAMR
ncbi:MAG: pyridoxal phosphate-dependent decarboxylase family protein, partial [Gemmatimonadales bacterium]